MRSCHARTTARLDAVSPRQPGVLSGFSPKPWLGRQVPVRRIVFKEEPELRRELTRAGLAAEAGVQRRAACGFEHVSSTIVDNLSRWVVRAV